MSAPKKKTKAPGTAPRKNGLSEIAPEVYVGGWKDAETFGGTRFCVLDEAPEGMPKGTHIPIYDEATDRAIVSNLDRLADSVMTARARGEPVLLFCGHGVRRSPLAGAWYLHRSEKISLDAAYDRIQNVRPKIERAEKWVGDAQNLRGPR
ncbi:MAG: dual specificity protein phosphatase family protein [Thermoplasmata archaeon]|nr:dual specificity protein phosphatase family protein [Thermoplasmata archaeon]